MTPPMIDTASPPEAGNVAFADDARAMEAATRQMSRWSNLLDRLSTE